MKLYDSKLESFLHSAELRALALPARYRDAEVRPILREQRSISFYPDGSFVRVNSSDDYEPYERINKPRGKIKGFSAKSRQRLTSLCAMLKREVTALFLTLTWPGVWSPDPKEWKICLDTFIKRLVRAYPECSGIWKLEPQERGAPHYHLLLFGIDFIPHEILSRWWFEIVGSGDEKHLQAGIQIRMARSRKAVMHYASKIYMGKEVKGFEGVGRFWGCFNRKKLPLSSEEKIEISGSELVFFQRIARRYIQKKQKEAFLAKRRLGKCGKYRRFRCGKPARIFCNSPEQFKRLVDWASKEYYDQQQKLGRPF